MNAQDLLFYREKEGLMDSLFIASVGISVSRGLHATELSAIHELNAFHRNSTVRDDL